MKNVFITVGSIAAKSLAIFAFIALTGCVATLPPQNSSNEPQPTSSNLSYGLIQQVVVKGVPKDKILEKLGSPNMITGGSGNNETWIYDKVSSTVQADTASAGAAVGGAVVGGSAGIGGGVGMSNSTARSTTSQRTLTLIIKFDKDVVDSFSTRATTF